MLAFVSPSARAYLEQGGVRVRRRRTETDVAAVFVAHVDAVEFPELERAARVAARTARRS